MSLKKDMAMYYIKDALLNATSEYRNLDAEYLQHYGLEQIHHVKEMYDELWSSFDEKAETLLEDLLRITGGDV